MCGNQLIPTGIGDNAPANHFDIDNALNANVAMTKNTPYSTIVSSTHSASARILTIPDSSSLTVVGIVRVYGSDIKHVLRIWISHIDSNIALSGDSNAIGAFGPRTDNKALP